MQCRPARQLALLWEQLLLLLLLLLLWVILVVQPLVLPLWGDRRASCGVFLRTDELVAQRRALEYYFVSFGQ